MDERNITYMFYGLAVAWGLLAVYAVLLGLREQDLKKQLDTLKRMVEEKK
jgi:CcmD family protein